MVRSSRAAFWLPLVALALATPALAQPQAGEAPLITNPDWAGLPDFDDIGSLYPKKALKAEVSRAATIACDVRSTGALHGCRVTAEEPTGYGFGEALKLAPHFKMRSKTLDGRPVEGGRVTVPVRWKVPPMPITLTCSLGGAEHMIGGKNWRVYGCDDKQSLLIAAAAPGSEKKSLLIVRDTPGGVQILGPGYAAEPARTAFDELTSAQVTELMREAERLGRTTPPVGLVFVPPPPAVTPPAAPPPAPPAASPPRGTPTPAPAPR